MRAATIGGDIERLVRDLEAVFGEIAALRARVSVLEGRAAAAVDGVDTDLVVSIAQETRGRGFTCRELVKHARLHPELAGALLAADVTSPRTLGKFLQRVERAAVGDLRVTRSGVDHRDGIVWMVVVVESRPLDHRASVIVAHSRRDRVDR